MTPLERLEAVLAPDVVAAVLELVDERVDARLDALGLAEPAREWLPVEEAATLLGCSVEAARRRAKRGRLDSRRQGRSVYISASSIASLRGPL